MEIGGYGSISVFVVGESEFPDPMLMALGEIRRRW